MSQRVGFHPIEKPSSLRIIFQEVTLYINMKKIVFLIGVVSLLSTTGCIFPGGGRRDDGYRHHDVVVVGPPVVEVRPATVIVQ